MCQLSCKSKFESTSRSQKIETNKRKLSALLNWKISCKPSFWRELPPLLQCAPVERKDVSPESICVIQPIVASKIGVCELQHCYRARRNRLCLDAVLCLGTSVLMCLGVLTCSSQWKLLLRGSGKEAKFWECSIRTLVLYIHMLWSFRGIRFKFSLLEL